VGLNCCSSLVILRYGFDCLMRLPIYRKNFAQKDSSRLEYV